MDNNDNVVDIKQEVQQFIERMQSFGQQENLDDINNHLSQITRAQNIAPRPMFNGFSSEQMTKLLYFPLKPGCPVQLRTLTEEEIEQIPFMRQALLLMNALHEKELKLTTKGALPVKMVEAIYQAGSRKWFYQMYKQKTEDKIPEVKMLHAILRETGLIKARLGKLSLTAEGTKLLNDHNKLLRTMVLFLFTTFHTGWDDPYEDFNVGNVGRLYSLWLLHHYGTQWRDIKFYSQEYFNAFPSLRQENLNKYPTLDDLYTRRVYFRLFHMLDLCEIRKVKDESAFIGFHDDVRKTPLVDMIFSFEEPAQI